MIYVAKGREIGLETRGIALEGHIVAEVLTPTGWKVVDPDLGIFWNSSLAGLGQAVTAREVAEAIRQKGFPEADVERLTRIYVSQEDNYAFDYPQSPHRYQLEQGAIRLKWVLPLTLLAAELVPAPGGLLLALMRMAWAAMTSPRAGGLISINATERLKKRLLSER